MSRYGAYDMAGNVKEWVWNEADENRYILGGGWEDPTYRFGYPEARPPFDRSPMNGFRCAVYLDDQPVDEALFASIELPIRNFERQTPVDDETFADYLSRYDYDQSPLEAVEDSPVQESEYWRRQKVTFNAAYGNERMNAYIYLPHEVEPPYQTVLYFPGTGAIFADSIEDVEVYNARLIDFVIQSGRALVLPIYKSTVERRDGLTSTWPSATVAFTEHVRQWVNDVSRTIDYLETRDDIDTSKLAYYGFSWGGRMGARVPAVERRFSAVVLVAGALALSDARPEANQVNFAPRITAPVLMLNGRHDFIEPVDTAQRPLFELLGTPDSDKRHVIFEGAGHTSNLPRTEMIAEILGWLDRYLGPVN
jgi:dienelactone hydrolase